MPARLLLLGALAFLAYGVYQFARRRSASSPAPQRKEKVEEERTQIEPNEPPVGGSQVVRRVRFRTASPPLKQSLPDEESDDIQGKEHEKNDYVIVAGTASQPDLIVDDESDCSLLLEVIAGPSVGLRLRLECKDASTQEVTIGRTPDNSIALNDPEVSGRHALITWNSKALCWQLVDLGSLNGTSLNERAVSSGNTKSRQRSEPVTLEDGMEIMLASTSKLKVHLESITRPLSGQEGHPPLSIGVAAASMSDKRGKALPMEDCCLSKWPLAGLPDFGVFAVFDGHGGALAAQEACTLMPAKLTSLLSSREVRSAVIEESNAASVLRDAFAATEAALSHDYQGCTATVLLIWKDGNKNLLTQCANVGDSHCFISHNGRIIQATEDHRASNPKEKNRLAEAGTTLQEGENRLFGLALARALGDKFLKSQSVGLSAKPFVGKALRVTGDTPCYAVLASDGLWDELSGKRALQLVLEVKKDSTTGVGVAQRAADDLVDKAKKLKAHDNVSVMVLDFEQHDQ